MKAVKLITFAIFAAIILSSCTASLNNSTKMDSYQENQIEQLKDLYSSSLDHELNSVVESAMMCICKLKLKYPESDFSELISKTKDLAINGKSACIRYKALMTTILLENPDLVNADYDVVCGYDDYQFYNLVSANINKELIRLQ